MYNHQKWVDKVLKSAMSQLVKQRELILTQFIHLEPLPKDFQGK